MFLFLLLCVRGRLTCFRGFFRPFLCCSLSLPIRCFIPLFKFSSILKINVLCHFSNTMQNSVTLKNSNLLNECNYKIWKIKLSAGQLNIYNMSSIWKKIFEDNTSDRTSFKFITITAVAYLQLLDVLMDKTWNIRFCKSR